MTPAEYIETVLNRFASAEFIARTSLIREFSNTQKGHLRVRVTFADGTFLEFYEYIEQADTDQIRVVTYAYHWSTANGKLIRRWDNTHIFPTSPMPRITSTIAKQIKSRPDRPRIFSRY